MQRLLEHGWWPVVAWTAGAMMGAGALFDNSFLTHVATGRLMAERGAPHRDVFTFASSGKHVVVQSWLASWIYDALDAVGGGRAIRVLVVVLTAVLCATLWRLSRPADALVARLGLVAIGVMTGMLWWNERPQLIAFVALALAAVVVTERRSPWWLVPLFAVWVNVHGSFPLGLVFVGGMAAITVAESRRVTLRSVAYPLVATAAVVGGALVSPYGSELLTFPIELLGRSSSLILISEWRPMSFDTFNNIAFVAQAVAVLALLVWRRAWWRLALAAVFVGLALMAVRNAAQAALVLIPLAAPCLAGLGTHDEVPRPGSRRLVAAGALATALVVGVVVATPDYDLSPYPVAAVDWMERQGYVGVAGSEADVLSYDYTGNYLEWRYGTDARPWIDDRAELHAYETVRDYVGLLSDKGDTATVLARHPHDLVLWEIRSPLGRYLRSSPDYRIIYRDRGTLIACRLASAHC